MAEKRWTWDRRSHPEVLAVLDCPVADLAWCDRLESAAADALTGKMLCVCAAAAVARAVISDDPDRSPATDDALDLLSKWIDDPTDEQFGQLTAIIFPERESSALDPRGVVWWALRTATSSVGNFEAGWALASACGAAAAAGLNAEQLRAAVSQEVTLRCVG